MAGRSGLRYAVCGACECKVRKFFRYFQICGFDRAAGEREGDPSMNLGSRTMRLACWHGSACGTLLIHALKGGIGPSLLGIGEDYGGMDLDAVLTGKAQDGLGQLRFQFVGAIAEIGFRCTYVRGIGHGVFAALGEAVEGVGEFAAFGRIKYIAHSRGFILVIFLIRGWGGM